ncbi:putative hydrolase of the alpha/beta superfamily protein [Luteitalea pratensis]|uniref:Putative hydrolase of the alpha/beta superfamily protein n=1 Tax=Luteitalea pratensis TaxID=1855912 RepID=A0A143PUS2_LUTPR|nr:alpha/beta hydrolase-fold protein [Luteitalea pratensis]AMY12415.1 putative hydrolase of the alpha/beta superfamily protein [Luteitalea pratensis]
MTDVRSRVLRLAGAFCAALLIAGLLIRVSPEAAQSTGVQIRVSFPGSLEAQRIDGRLLVMLSTDAKAEPRFQITDDAATQLVFGIDVDGLAPGTPAIVDATATGYPMRSLRDLPAGTYTAQALLHRYETFRRGDGHVVKLPMDRGEGQQWNRAPGNLYSTPVQVTIGKDATVDLTLDKVIAPIPPPPATKYIRHERIRSEKLSKFWGRDMYLGAHVLVPEGFDTHPEARYSLMIDHGHFPSTFEGFREEKPDPTLKPDHNARFNMDGYNRYQQQAAYDLYKEWTGAGFPRVLIIQIQHPTPFYDDSYAVNSANAGPWGDAIVEELIPYIEKKYRGIGQGWARFMYGGSTGGWEALAAQVFYPDAFNGAYAACPDPIDFRAYTVVNLYEDANAYYVDSRWKKTPRPGHRNWLGHVSTTLEDMNLRELALGTRTRSGQQWDVWEATYSPVGADGYPKRIWDKVTGQIDKDVAAYWKQHYDLVHIMQRDWEKGLGKKLAGKVNLYVGDMDNYYLNNAVYLAENFLRATTNPWFDGEVTYGDRAEHCWNGDPVRPNYASRLRYHQMFVPKAVARMEKTAPKGADLKSWRY